MLVKIIVTIKISSLQTLNTAIPDSQMLLQIRMQILEMQQMFRIAAYILQIITLHSRKN